MRCAQTVLELLILICSVMCAPLMKRVVGGVPVRPGQFNFVVIILHHEDSVCTGSIVAPSWVLTARHCVAAMKEHVGHFTVAAGSIAIDTDGKAERALQIRHVSDTKIYSQSSEEKHPVFPNLTIDIGLVKVNPSFQINPYVGVARTPIVNVWPRGKTRDCTAVGWGPVSTVKTNVFRILSYYPVRVGDLSYCFPELYHPPNYWLLCSVSSGGEGRHLGMSCSGDSGGAIVCENFLVGIISGKLFLDKLHNKTSSKNTCSVLGSDQLVFNTYMSTSYFREWLVHETRGDKHW